MLQKKFRAFPAVPGRIAIGDFIINVMKQPCNGPHFRVFVKSWSQFAHDGLGGQAVGHQFFIFQMRGQQQKCIFPGNTRFAMG